MLPAAAAVKTSLQLPSAQPWLPPQRAAPRCCPSAAPGALLLRDNNPSPFAVLPRSPLLVPSPTAAKAGAGTWGAIETQEERLRRGRGAVGLAGDSTEA